MMQLHDLDIQHLKDIPGYKAILKAVIKSQIQQLVEQLADHTGEESVILTASVSDGTLCNLGSSQGKNFLDGRDEIKSQFLRYCLKRTQRKKQTDSQSGILKEPGGDGDPYETRGPRIPEPRVPTMHQPVSHPSQRVHPHPVAISKVGGQGQSYIDRGGRGGFPGESPKRSFPSSSPHRQDHHTPLKHGRVSLPAESLPSSYSDINPSHSRSPITSTPSSRTAIPPTSSNVNIQKIDLSNPANVKLESPSFQDIVESESNEGSSSHGALQDQINQDVSTEGFQGLTSPAEDSSHAHGFGGEETDTATTTTTGALDNSSNPVDAAQVKIEPITESEMELEITGVEMATRNIDDSYNNESWMSGRLGYGQQASGEDSEASGEANQSGMGQSTEKLDSSKLGNVDNECETCHKVFQRASYLRIHNRVHTGEKPYQCPYCEKAFAQRGNMKAHARRHPKEKSTEKLDSSRFGNVDNECETCHKVFQTASHLRIHNRVHTGGNAYQCFYCRKTFAKKGSMAAHARTHRKKESKTIINHNFLYIVNGNRFK